jgi:hypothetical protein
MFLPLESVGIAIRGKLISVGIIFRSNRELYDSNAFAVIDYQYDKPISSHLLECWSGGTKNNTPGN